MGIYTSTNPIEEALESGAAIGFSTNVTRVLTNDNFNKFIGYGGYTPRMFPTIVLYSAEWKFRKTPVNGRMRELPNIG